MPTPLEETIAELHKWLELRCAKCTYLELRTNPSSESMLNSWTLNVETVPAILEEIVGIVEQATRPVTASKTVFLFAFRTEDAPKHDSRFALTWEKGKDKDDEGSLGTIRELRGMNKELHQANLDAMRIVVESARVTSEAHTQQVKNLTAQILEHNKDTWRIHEALRAVAEDKRGTLREEAEIKKDAERSRVGGELLTMLAPALLARAMPGSVAANKATGDGAVAALLRTFTDGQRTELVETGILALSTEQMTAALTLVGEIKAGQGNGGIESPLLRELAAWLGMLADEQSAQLAMGRVQLNETQAAAFLELYVHAAEHAEGRGGRQSTDARSVGVVS